jgi:hypothetical protein
MHHGQGARGGIATDIGAFITAIVVWFQSVTTSACALAMVATSKPSAAAKRFMNTLPRIRAK